IIGRGTQDMKGIGAVHYFALKALKQAGIYPRRTIHIFAVPDEEIGGFTGSKQFVETEQFKNLHIGFIIDEGHASGDDHILDIKVPPTRKRQEVLNMIEKIMSQYSHLTYTILAQATEEPDIQDYHTPLYQALSKTIEKHRLQARPHFFEASSDLRFYQARGI